MNNMNSGTEYIGRWIWLDPERFPNRQTSRLTGDWSAECDNGTVVEFRREVTYERAIERIELSYSSDGVSQVWVNGRFIGTGPVNIGGDFYGNDRPRRNRYFSTLSLSQGEDAPLNGRLSLAEMGKQLEILARVRLDPVQICEFSMGHGGFAMLARVYFADGTSEQIETDENWTATLCPEYESAAGYDAGKKGGRVTTHAVPTPDIWMPTRSPLPHRVERPRAPIGEHEFEIAPATERTVTVEYDKIYAAFTRTEVIADGEVEIILDILETGADTVAKSEHLVFNGSGEYTGVRMYGVGMLRAHITNRGTGAATVNIGINEAYLPAAQECRTLTSDDGLNQILDVAAHTLKYCRQYIHLDSPKHCEPLACTGDYFIESEMEAFSFGDMALAAFDLIRTARLLEHQGGEMFHPTYSLIWVRMLHNVYMRTGDVTLLRECEDALTLLLSVFKGYLGKEGLIDTPPSFMFVDWITVDGHSLHHPPKALGQGVINCFYYDALTAAANIYDTLGNGESANEARREAEQLKRCIKDHLYDEGRGLFCEGLTTPTPKDRLGYYMPENTDTRYFRINTNALAVYCGVVDGDEARELLGRVLDDPQFCDYQPYFAHFVLGAIHRAGLDAEYLMPILDHWREPIKECAKGLPEGFIPPEDGYVFDHSHAWGGTPLYSLPMALSSLEILEAGMTHIRLTPRLLGLSDATVEIPTPNGTVRIEMTRGTPARITAPSNIRVDVTSKGE